MGVGKAKRRSKAARPVLEGEADDDDGDATDVPEANAGGEESSGEEPMKEATEEELKAEVNRQSAVLAELFPDAQRPSADGGGRSRGSGPLGRSGSGAGAVGRGGLLVSRFVPLSAQTSSSSAPQESAAEAASSSRPGEADGKSARKRRRKDEDEGVTAAVNPAFARVFRGGPRRKEADLPDQGDEGLEEAPAPPPQEQGGDAMAGWLTSLGEEAPAPPEQGPGDIDWLGSLKADAKSSAAAAAAAGKSKAGAGAKSETSAAVAKWAGKALDIAPFWRTQPEEELIQVWLDHQSESWQRIRRLAQSAKRREEKRGRVRSRQHF